MLRTSEGDLLLVKLEDGEDVHARLVEVCEEHDFKCGWVLGGIGILRQFTLGYFTGKEYLKQYFEEPHELLSMSGSVTLDAKVPIHLHCSVSSKTFEAYGGHLFEGKANVLNEILVRGFDRMKLGRVLNAKTGYYELDIDMK